MPKGKSANPADMYEDAVKARDRVQAALDRENEKVTRATEKATAAETAKRNAVDERDRVQTELAEAQRLVDALAALVPGAPDSQTVVPDGVQTGEAVLTEAASAR